MPKTLTATEFDASGAIGRTNPPSEVVQAVLDAKIDDVLLFDVDELNAYVEPTDDGEESPLDVARRLRNRITTYVNKIPGKPFHTKNKLAQADDGSFLGLMVQKRKGASPRAS